MNRTITLFGILVALVLTGIGLHACSSNAATKNESQALTYYGIGQAYKEIHSLRVKDRIDLPEERRLVLQVEFAEGMLDLTRKPSVQAIQDGLTQVVNQMRAEHLLTPPQEEMALGALAIAKNYINGGALPASTDYASWLMVGSDVLNTVASTVAVKKGGH